MPFNWAFSSFRNLIANRFSGLFLQASSLAETHFSCAGPPSDNVVTHERILPNPLMLLTTIIFSP
jgi:hypothetical protein